MDGPGATARKGDPVAAELGDLRREAERLLRQMLEGETRLRALGRAAWQIQEEERRHVARELHDGIGQLLTALQNQLARLQPHPDARAPDWEAELRRARDLASAALGETRALSRRLRPAVLDDLGLAAALGWLTRSLREASGVEVAVELDGLPERFDPELETAAFRIIQEALNNVAKHAATGRARVTVRLEAGLLRLGVSDRGKGFRTEEALDPRAGKAPFGLGAMRDRVELLGGRFRLSSSPGEGTRLEAELPMEDETGDRHG